MSKGVWDHSSLSLHSPSGSHQRLTQEGVAMPYWGARERLLFPLGVKRNNNCQCIAMQCRAVKSDPLQPKLKQAAEAMRDQALTPLQPSEEEFQNSLAFLMPQPAK